MRRARGKEERQRLSQSGVSTWLKILSQIHSRVHRCNVLCVTIEWQRLSFEELAKTPLGGLAPSRMIHSGVDVCIEAIFIWSLLHPGCDRLFIDEANFRDRLDAFKTVLPWRDQSDRRTVLIGKRLFSVEPNGQNRQRIHRLVHSQALYVWQLQNISALLRKLIGRIERLEFDKPRQRRRFEAFEQFTQLKPLPGNHHRPTLHTSHAVDSVLNRHSPDEIIESINLWLSHETLH